MQNKYLKIWILTFIPSLIGGYITKLSCYSWVPGVVVFLTAIAFSGLICYVEANDNNDYTGPN